MRRVAVLMLSIAVVAVAGPGVSPAQARPAYTEYVALGDSWSADATFIQGTTQFTPPGCVQNRLNYAKQVAAALAVPVFRDATCAEATTADLPGPQQTPDGTNAPQLDRLGATTDLVTLGIGGNDAQLASTIRRCVTVDPAVSPCQNTMIVNGVDQMSVNIAAAEPKVTAAIAAIRSRAPRARVLLVNYLEGIDTIGGCFPTIPISNTDAAWLGRKLLELDTMLAQVASATGIELADTYRDSAGHDACRPPGIRWVEGLVPWSADPVGPAVPFHPNQLGADYQARRVLATIEG